jgi:hypothetical protein
MSLHQNGRFHPTGRAGNLCLLDIDGFATVARKHEDCMLIPEHKTSCYWAYTASCSELRHGFTSTPPDIRETYPRAFSALGAVDGPPSLDFIADQPTAAVKSGDILLFRAGWPDPANSRIKKNYADAPKSPHEPK